MIGKIYIKKIGVIVLDKTDKGILVCNQNDKDKLDKWIIPHDVFKSTYIEKD